MNDWLLIVLIIENTYSDQNCGSMYEFNIYSTFDSQSPTRFHLFRKIDHNKNQYKSSMFIHKTYFK